MHETWHDCSQMSTVTEKTRGPLRKSNMAAIIQDGHHTFFIFYFVSLSFSFQATSTHFISNHMFLRSEKSILMTELRFCHYLLK